MLNVGSFWSIVRFSVVRLVSSRLFLWVSAAYVFGIQFWFFVVHGFFSRGIAEFIDYFAIAVVALIVHVPVAAAVVWSIFRKDAGGELFYSFPVSGLVWTAAQCGAVWVVIFLQQLLLLAVPCLLFAFGAFDPGVFVSSVTGFLSAGIFLCGISLFFNTLTGGHPAAGALSILAVLLGAYAYDLLYFAGIRGWLLQISEWISITRMTRPFFIGIVETARIGLLLLYTAVCMYVSSFMLDNKRKGATW